MGVFEYYSIDLNDLSTAHSQVLTYWKSIQGNRLAPTWSEFDIMKIPFQLIPSTIVADVLDGGQDYQFRFYGSRLVEVHGDELTGKSISDLRPSEIAEAIKKSYDVALEMKAPLAHRTDAGVSLVKFQVSLRLPLSDDGDTVSHLVSVVEYDQKTHDLRDRLNSALEKKT